MTKKNAIYSVVLLVCIISIMAFGLSNFFDTMLTFFIQGRIPFTDLQINSALTFGVLYLLLAWAGLGTVRDVKNSYWNHRYDIINSEPRASLSSFNLQNKAAEDSIEIKPTPVNLSVVE